MSQIVRRDLLEIWNGFSAVELADVIRKSGEGAVPANLARRAERIAVAKGIIRREIHREVYPPVAAAEAL